MITTTQQPSFLCTPASTSALVPVKSSTSALVSTKSPVSTSANTRSIVLFKSAVFEYSGGTGSVPYRSDTDIYYKYLCYFSKLKKDMTKCPTLEYFNYLGKFVSAYDYEFNAAFELPYEKDKVRYMFVMDRVMVQLCMCDVIYPVTFTDGFVYRTVPGGDVLRIGAMPNDFVRVQHMDNGILPLDEQVEVDLARAREHSETNGESGFMFSTETDTAWGDPIPEPPVSRVRSVRSTMRAMRNSTPEFDLPSASLDSSGEPVDFPNILHDRNGSSFSFAGCDSVVSSVKSAIGSAVNVASGAYGISKDAFSSIFTKVYGMFTHTASLIKTLTIVDNVRHWFVDNMSSIVSRIVAGVCLLYVLQSDADIKIKVASGALAAATLYPGGADGLCDKFFELVSSFGSRIFQDGELSSSVGELMSFVSASIVNLIVPCASLLSFTNVVKVSAGVLTMLRLRKELTNIDLLAYLPAFITRWFGLTLSVNPNHLLRTLNVQLIETHHDYCLDTVANGPAMVTAYTNLFENTKKYTNDVELGVYNTTQNNLKVMFPLVKPLLDEIGVDGTRQLPYWIYIVGGKGIGKSVLSARLSKEFQESHLLGNRVMGSYNKSPSEAHWNGYNGQPVLLLEDFLSVRDDPTIVEMLRLVSNHPTTVDMASMDNPVIGIKGQHFISKLIISTSNFYTTAHLPILANSDAWYSRRGIVVEPTIVDTDGNETKKYFGTNQRLNFSLVKKDYEMTDTELIFHCPYLRFRVYNSCALKPCQGVRMITYKELVVVLSKGYEVNKTLKVELPRTQMTVTKTSDALPVSDDDFEDVIVEDEGAFPEDPLTPGQEAANDLAEMRVTQMFPNHNHPSEEATVPMVERGRGGGCTRGRRTVRVNRASNGRPRTAVTTLPPCSGVECSCGASLSSLDNYAHAQLHLNPLYEGLGGDTLVLPARVEKALEKVRDIKLESCGFEGYTNYMLVVKVLSIGAAGVATYKMGGWIMDYFKGFREQQVYAEKSPKPVKAPFYKRVPHSGTDNMLGTVLRNCGTISTKSSDGERYYGSFFSPGGRYIVFPAHFVSKIGIPDKETIYVHFGCSRDPVPCTLNKESLVWFKNSDGSRSDLVAMLVNNLPQARNILHFLPQESDFEKVDANKCMIVGYRTIANAIVFCEHPVTHATRIKDNYNQDDLGYRDTFRLTLPRLSNGDCGKLLIDTSSGKVIGMYHSAAQSSGIGFAQALHQGMFPSGEKGEFRVSHCGVEIADPEGVSRLDLPIGMCRQLGTVPVVRGCEKSSLVKSFNFEKFDCCTPSLKSPSVLKRVDFTKPSPLINCVGKFAVQAKPFPVKLLKESSSWILSAVTEVNPKVTPKVRSLSEAINGVPGVPGLDALSLSSSPGFPHVLTRRPGVLGKGYQFQGEPGERFLVDKLVISRYDEMLAGAKLGLWCLFMYWIKSLKCEKLKNAKVENCDTRGFAIGPTDYLLLCKQYFMDFSKYITDNFQRLPPSVGMDADGVDWDIIFTRLSRYGRTCGFDGDYKKWDGMCAPDVVMAMTDVMNGWYKAFDPTWKLEDDVVRSTLMYMACYGQYIVHDVAFQAMGGIPSGHFLTAVINSLVNWCYVIMCVIDLFPNITRADFERLVDLLVYGDDNIVAVSPELDFCGSDLQAFLARYGIAYTPGDKSETFGPNKSLLELEYLKHKTRIIGRNKVGVVLPITVNALLNWTRLPKVTGTTLALQTKEDMENALKYLIKYKDSADFYQVYQGYVCFCRNNMLGSIMTMREIFETFVKPSWGDLLLLEDLLVDEREWQMDTKGGATVMSVANKVVEGHTRAYYRVSPKTPIDSECVEYSKIVNKWFVVESGSWEAVDVDGSILKKWNLPLDLLTNQQLAQPFRNMQYWRGDVEVKLLLNGTPFHQGLLVLWFGPMLSEIRSDVYPGTSRIAMSQLQHGFVSPQESGSLTFKIPYAHLTNYLSTTMPLLPGDDVVTSMGVLGLSVFSQLVPATNASPSLSWSLSVRFPGSEFHLPRPLTLVPQLRVLHGGGGSKKGDTYNDFTYTISGGSNTFTPEIGDEYGEASGGSFDMKTDVTGGSSLDAPNCGRTPVMVYNRGSPYLNQIDQPTFCNKLASSAVEHVPVGGDTFGPRGDEMDFSFLSTKMSFVDEIDWGVSDPSGTLLASGLIVPSYYCVNSRPAPVGGIPSIEPAIPICDYLPNLFKYWRGPIDVKVVIVASPFATGKLLVTPMYGYFGADINYEQSDSQYFELLDLSQKVREYNFRWNFPSNTPYKLVTSTHKSLMSEDTKSRVSPGSFYVFVMNDFRVGEGIPAACKILISISIPDVELAFYNPQNIVPLPPGNFIPQEARVLQAGDPLTESETSSDVVQGVGTVHVKKGGMLRFRSLKDLMKKGVLVAAEDVTAVRYSIPVDNLFFNNSRIIFISILYAGRIGGVRLMASQDTASTFGETAHLYWVPGAQDSNLDLLAKTNAYNFSFAKCSRDNINAVMWVESTFTTEYNFLLLPQATSFSSSGTMVDPTIATVNREYTNEGHFIYDEGLNEGQATLRCYMSMDDHSRFGLFIGAAACTVNDYDADV